MYMGQEGKNVSGMRQGKCIWDEKEKLCLV